MLKKSENNGTEEIGFVTPTPGVLIFSTAPKAVCRICSNSIQRWTVAEYKLPSQTLVVIIPTNIQPVIIEVIVQFSGHGLPRREIPKIAGVSPGVVS